MSSEQQPPEYRYVDCHEADDGCCPASSANLKPTDLRYRLDSPADPLVRLSEVEEAVRAELEAVDSIARLNGESGVDTDYSTDAVLDRLRRNQD